MSKQPASAAETDEPEANARGELADRSRRRFVRQASIVGAASLGAGWASLAPPDWPLSLRDPDGERGKPKTSAMTLPAGGFVVAPQPGAADLGIAHGKDIPAMLKAAVHAIGGIERFIDQGDVVVIKPNVAFERAAPLGATTDPAVLRALIALCLQAGASEVRVVDNPIESPEACFERSGLRSAAVESGARVYLPTPNDFRPLFTKGASLIERWPFFWRPFIGAHKVIGVAPVKDHNLCSASMTTKNWYGLLGGRRNQFHQDIHGIIADLALMMRPTFVVLDAVRVLFRSGPTGGSLADVKAGHTLVAATDSLAADAYGWAKLLERDSEPLPKYFANCEQRHLGSSDWRSLNVREEQVG